MVTIGKGATEKAGGGEQLQCGDASARAQEALKDSEHFYRALIEKMGGFAYCRMLFEDGEPADFIYLMVNEAFEKETGLQDVCGKKITEIIPEIRTANPEIFKAYGRVATTGRPEHFEAFVGPLQEWFSISAYSPAPEHFVAVFDVVTERKRAEAALAESEANLRAVLNATDESMFLLAPDSTILTANDVGAQRMGMSRGASAGNRMLDVLPPEVAARRRPFMERALSGQHVTFEDERNGRWMQTHMYPVLDAKGQVVRLAVYSRDITERRQAEEHKQATLEALKKAVTEVRTLRGIVPICSNCKKIRDDEGFWEQVEVYVHNHTEAEFSHGICPDCLRALYPWLAEESTGSGSGGGKP